MSTASTPSASAVRRRRRGQQGFSLIEVSAVIAILALMSFVVERTLATAQASDRWLTAVRKSTERGQKLAYHLREIVSASRKLFSNDAVGQGYLQALERSRDPMQADARMPVIDEVSGLGPDDAGYPKTGNVLLFVREADAAPAVADPATQNIRYIDTYRFVCVYPRVQDNFVVTGANQQNAWDLVIWRSEPFPSYGQINEISNPFHRTNVIRDLYNRFGYQFAWDANRSVDDAFFAMDALGAMSGTPTPGLTIAEDVAVSERGRLAYANVQLAPTDADDYHRRPVFTVDQDWDPHGFEVKIVGASGSRKVWMHLVVEVQATRDQVAVQPCTVIASTRDL